MKSFGIAVTLAGAFLLAGSASAQMRYAGRTEHDAGPVRQVGFHGDYYGYNEIEAGGCCGQGGCGGICGGCGPCHKNCCLLPCVLRGIGRALDCLLPCGRCCGGGCGGCGGCGKCATGCSPCRGVFGCSIGCKRCPYYGCGGCNAVPYQHARPPLYGHGGGGCASCGGHGDSVPYSAPFAPPMKTDPFTDDVPDAMPTPAAPRAPANSTRPSGGSSRVVRPSRTAAYERPEVQEEVEERPAKRTVTKAKPIVGTGVAKVVHEEAVTVKKPVSSLKKLPRDEAPAPPALLFEDEDEHRVSLPRNPLRR